MAPSNIEARIKLRHLALVIAIHNLGSLRRASEALNVTQPAATNALKELETSLGATLFTRSKSGMRPTTFGALLVERSRLILGNLHAMALEIEQLKDGEAGDVHMGTLPAAAETLVPRAVQMIRKSKPKVVIHLIEGSTAQLLPALERGDLDLVVGRIPLSQIGKKFHYEQLMAEPDEVVCRREHKLVGKRRVTLEDLAAQDWILPEEGSHVRTEFQETFIRAGIQPPRPVLVTSSTTARAALLAMTDMLGVLTQRAARAYEKRGELKILEASIYARMAPTTIVTRTEAMLTPAASSLVEFLRAAATVPENEN